MDKNDKKTLPGGRKTPLWKLLLRASKNDRQSGDLDGQTQPQIEANGEKTVIVDQPTLPSVWSSVPLGSELAATRIYDLTPKNFVNMYATVGKLVVTNTSFWTVEVQSDQSLSDQSVKNFVSVPIKSFEALIRIGTKNCVATVFSVSIDPVAHMISHVLILIDDAFVSMNTDMSLDSTCSVWTPFLMDCDYFIGNAQRND